MKKIIEYLKHILTHQWVEGQSEGPHTEFKCNGCDRTWIRTFY